MSDHVIIVGAENDEHYHEKARHYYNEISSYAEIRKTLSSTFKNTNFEIVLCKCDGVKAGTLINEEHLSNADGLLVLPLSCVARLDHMRSAFFDMDSTLINEETIDELARSYGFQAEVEKLTKAAMQGDLDFTTALRNRMALFKGLKLDSLVASFSPTVTVGVEELMNSLQACKVELEIVSGGFHPFVDDLRDKLNMCGATANSWEVTEDGIITGNPKGKIINEMVKKELVQNSIEKCEISSGEFVMAVGDGSNDAGMVEAATLGVAFCGKPVLESVSDAIIRKRDFRVLSGLLEALYKAQQACLQSQ